MAKGLPEREIHMAVSLLVLGGLLLVGFVFSRLKARKGTKQDMPKLFP
jgi:hypothetical protein